MKLSDLTPADLRELRVLAAIERAYEVETAPFGDKRASVILSKYKALISSRDHARSANGAAHRQSEG